MSGTNGSKLELDWIRTLAAALGAVSSAVLLSTVGAAGTILGAAVGSVVVTVSTALYSQGLARSKERVAAAQEQALVRVRLARADVHRASHDPESTTDLARAREELSRAEAGLDDAPSDPGPASWRERLSVLPWRRIGLLAGALFLAVVALITVFELVIGRPVSAVVGGSGKGGTSITRVVDPGGGGTDRQRNPDHPGESPSPTDTVPTDPSSPLTADPSDPADPESSESSEPSEPSEPSETSVPSESAEPSATPTGSAPAAPAP
jgi:hypothetical protein